MDRFCAAPECGKLLVQRHDEAASDFRDRKSCGPSCGSRIPRRRDAPERNVGICRFCGAPTKRRSNGEMSVSCAAPACRKNAYRRHQMDDLPWPTQTGEVAASFHTHEIVPRDVYGTLPMRPETIVKTQSGIA